jgi:hypothetical protein
MKFDKYIALAVTLIMAHSSFAQDCHFDVNEKDKFSGEITKKADQRLGSIMTHWNIVLEQRGAKFFIGLRTLKNEAVRAAVTKGDKFYLRLEDGNVIEIVADNDYEPSFYAANGGVQTTITTRGEVDIEAMKKLSASPLTDIKMTVGGKDLTQSKILSKQSKNVMEYAACLVASK